MQWEPSDEYIIPTFELSLEPIENLYKNTNISLLFTIKDYVVYLCDEDVNSKRYLLTPLVNESLCNLKSHKITVRDYIKAHPEIIIYQTGLLAKMWKGPLTVVPEECLPPIRAYLY